MWNKFKSLVKELLAFVTDYQWHLDGYKIAGF